MTTIQQSRARFIAELEEEKRSAIEHMNAAGHTGCRPKACRVEEILILIEKVLMQVRVARSSKEWTAAMDTFRDGLNEIAPPPSMRGPEGGK